MTNIRYKIKIDILFDTIFFNIYTNGIKNVLIGLKYFLWPHTVRVIEVLRLYEKNTH